MVLRGHASRARRVARDFPDANDARKVRDELQSLDCPESARVARCILHLAKGSVDGVVRNVASAMQDYRDSIVAAEYDSNDRRVRNFGEPFDD